MTQMTILNEYTPDILEDKDIIFISDLHFDFIKDTHNYEDATWMEDDFISFVKEHYSNNIICVAGDFYNSYKKTLAFIRRMEEAQVNGFFVLGNHDYWNNGETRHVEIIDLFSIETQNYKHFKFLVTGRKYYYQNICVIGDTGWTSFRRGKRQVSLEQFMNLPDAIKVKDFDPKNIINLHKKWVSFANFILNTEEKVLIITHFPMVDFTRKDSDCWFSSTTHISGDNCWRIFGHTHKHRDQKYNNASAQRGYRNIDIQTLKRKASENQYETTYGLGDYKFNKKNFEKKMAYVEYLKEKKAYINENWQSAIPKNQYDFCNFGRLVKATRRSDLVESNGIECLSAFYTSEIISSDCIDLALITKYKGRGYKRCSANKTNITVLAHNPAAYIARVNKVMDWYLKNIYIGYSLSWSLSNRAKEAIYHSISILESGDTSDVRAFMTAAVITGYVYNEMALRIEEMRPLDDYDILRFWMMFLTIKYFNIDMSEIDSVISNKQKPIYFNNLEMYLPTINGFSLTIEEGLFQLRKSALLALPTQGHYKRIT